MGSPLGLTNITAIIPNGRGGNGNSIVSNYVSGVKYVENQPNDGILTTDPNFTSQYNSIFNGTKWYYRPTTETNDGITTTKGSKRHDGRNDSTTDMYDISTNSIIQYTSHPNLQALRLEPSHFVYLKNYGVYPNNRLIVSRRFPSPIVNDLTSSEMSPLSTIVSWISDEQDSFFNFETSEQWTTGEPIDNPIGELTDLFNDVMGKTLPFSIGGESAGGISAAFKAFPMGGVAETLELGVVNYLLGSEGKPASNFSYDNLHRGNPNFMGESAYRKINSISSSVSIDIKASYEVQYINGIDPTIVFMDLLQNILRFSSSQSVFYMSQTGGDNINKFIDLFRKGEWFEAVGIIIDAIIYAVKDIASGIGEFMKDVVDTGKDILSGDLEGTSNAIKNALSMISRSSMARYRIDFNKIIPAMTGESSAPWHVTIGNPKNPFFSSGDMIAEGCKITFGNTLGFNDYPTRIDYEFTIKSARNLGIQEIFDKFNIGAGRQYQRNDITFKVDWNQGKIKDEVVERGDGIISNDNDSKTEEQAKAETELQENKRFGDYFKSLNSDEGGFSGIPEVDPKTGLDIISDPKVYGPEEEPNGGLANTAGELTGFNTFITPLNGDGGLGAFGG